MVRGNLSVESGTAGVALLISLGIVAAVVIGRFIALATPTLNEVLIASTAMVLAIPVVTRVVRRSLDPFEPIHFIVFIYAIMFVLRPMIIMRDDRYRIDLWFRQINLEASFTQALWLVLLGAASLVLGYESRGGLHISRVLPRRSQDVDGQSLTLAALAVGGLGTLLYTLYLVTSGASITTSFRNSAEFAQVGHVSGYLAIGPYLLLPSSLVLITYGIQARKSATRLFGLVLMMLFIVLMLATGDRLPMVPLASGLIVFHYVRRLRRPSVIAILGLLLLATIASSLVLHVRTSDGAPMRTVITSVLASPDTWISPLAEGQDNGFMEMFTISLQYIPEELPHELGRVSVGELFIRPVPRQFWPEKPLVPNKQLTREVWPEAYEAGIANPEYSTLTSLYWDGGIVGIALGMGGMGIIARALWEYFRAQPHKLEAMLLLGVGLALLAFGLRHNPVDNFLRIAFMMAPIWFIIGLGRRSFPSTSHAAPELGRGTLS
jgi:hypothetical protein